MFIFLNLDSLETSIIDILFNIQIQHTDTCLQIILFHMIILIYILHISFSATYTFILYLCVNTIKFNHDEMTEKLFKDDGFS